MNSKLLFTCTTKMADVIHQDYELIPILGRFGIQLGFGNKTIQEVCTEKNLNAEFFLEILNSVHNHNYFPGEHLQNFDAVLIINYLLNTHIYYRNIKVPEIESFIDKMEKEASSENCKNIKLLQHFFEEYKEEIQDHFNREENLIFPYVLSLENALVSEDFSEALTDRIRKEPIEIYERDHDSIEVKLSDLKNLIIRFLPPVLSEELCHKLLIELFRMEMDLESHTKIEEKVLVPKVKILEQKVLEVCGNY